jgi:hypothetical protein
LFLLEQAIINLLELGAGVLPGCPDVPKDVLGLIQDVLVQVWVLVHGIGGQATLVRVQVLGHPLVDMLELLGGCLVPRLEQLVVLVGPLDLGGVEQVLVHQGTGVYGCTSCHRNLELGPQGKPCVTWLGNGNMETQCIFLVMLTKLLDQTINATNMCTWKVAKIVNQVDHCQD